MADSVINDKGHMYTRALMANLSQAEYRNMVEYMLTTLGGNPDSGESDDEQEKAVEDNKENPVTETE